MPFFPNSEKMALRWADRNVCPTFTPASSMPRPTDGELVSVFREKTVYRRADLTAVVLTTMVLASAVLGAKQSDEGVEDLRRRALKGEAEAQFLLGAMYASARGVKQDFAEAVRLLRLAADQGHADAQASLGWMHAQGLGLDRNDKEAVKWYRAAANQGHADARFKLGTAYSRGRGVQRDLAKAIELYRTAAGQDHAGAQYLLGIMYANARGVPRDYTAALKWFRRAVNQGFARARSQLGMMYAMGLGVGRDDIAAHAHCSLAAAAGDSMGSVVRDNLENSMTPAQIAEARRLAKEWSGKARSGQAKPQSEGTTK